VKGVTPDGHMTDPDALEAEIKRAMVSRARRSALLVDGTKFERPALSLIAHATELTGVLAADVSASCVKRLTDAGVDVRTV